MDKAQQGLIAALSMAVSRAADQNPLATLICILVALVALAALSLTLTYRLRRAKLESDERKEFLRLIEKHELPKRLGVETARTMFAWLVQRSRR